MFFRGNSFPPSILERILLWSLLVSLLFGIGEVGGWRLSSFENRRRYFEVFLFLFHPFFFFLFLNLSLFFSFFFSHVIWGQQKDSYPLFMNYKDAPQKIKRIPIYISFIFLKGFFSFLLSFSFLFSPQLI